MHHRLDGPAVIHSSGLVEWWYMGWNMGFDKWCEKTNKTEEGKTQLKLQYGVGLDIVELSA